MTGDFMALARAPRRPSGRSAASAACGWSPPTLDWAMGKGDEVMGPGEARLMAMASRSDAVGELGGPGLPVLAGRVSGQRVR